MAALRAFSLLSVKSFVPLFSAKEPPKPPTFPKTLRIPLPDPEEDEDVPRVVPEPENAVAQLLVFPFIAPLV